MMCLEAVTGTKFSDPPRFHHQGSYVEPWWWRWSQSLKRCIWTTWHGCQPEKILVCTSMKRMSLFSLSSWNCGSEIHPTGTNCEPAFLCHLFEDAQKEWPEKYSRGLLLCHNSATPAMFHTCLAVVPGSPYSPHLPLQLLFLKLNLAVKWSRPDYSVTIQE